MFFQRDRLDMSSFAECYGVLLAPVMATPGAPEISTPPSHYWPSTPRSPGSKSISHEVYMSDGKMMKNVSKDPNI